MLKKYLIFALFFTTTQIHGEPFSIGASTIAILTKLGLITTVISGTDSVSVGASAGARIVVLTARGASVGAAIIFGSGAVVSYSLKRYWDQTYNSLPENTQKIINRLDYEQLKKRLDTLSIKYKILKGKNNEQAAIIADMSRVCTEFAVLFKNHGLNVAELPAKQQSVYREMQILRSMHEPKRICA